MNIPSKYRIASIGSNHAMILPYDANPKADGIFGKDNKDLGFQRSPWPEYSDQGAPDQPAKIAHRQRVSADSWSRSAVLSLR
jgi:hypothetical protein